MIPLQTKTRWLVGLLFCAMPIAAQAANNDCESTAQGEARVQFSDDFDSDILSAGWSWLREHKDFWRLNKGALEILVEPGKANTVTNALLRDAPDRSRDSYVVEVTVTNLTEPTQQFEQAGITWYRDGKPVFKLVKELVDGQVMIIPGRKPMEDAVVRLRLTVTADSWRAQYQPSAKGPFFEAATGELPRPGKDQVSIQCYSGPADARHWIRFDDFKIMKLTQ